MNQNVERAAHETRRYTPAMFAVIALCFLLPFVSLTCAGQRLVTFSGLDFVTGTDVSVDPEFSQDFLEGGGLDFDLDGQPNETEGGATDQESGSGTDSDRLDANVFAIVALAGALAGLALALLLKDRPRAFAATLAGDVVFIALIGLRIDFSGDLPDGEGIAGPEYRFGYWIALLLALVIGVAHFLYLRGVGTKQPEAHVDPPPPQPGSGT